MRSTNATDVGAGSRRAARSKSLAKSADGTRVGNGTVASLKQQAAEKVAELAGQVKDRSESFLSQQKARAADEIENIGRSIRESAGSLQEGPLADVSGYVEAAADSLDRASRYLAEQDWQTLRRDAERVVQRQPAWFLGGMLVAGLAIGRFLKASSTPAERVRSRRQARAAEDEDAPRRRPARGESRNGTRRTAGGERRRAAAE